MQLLRISLATVVAAAVQISLATVVAAAVQIYNS